MIDNWEAWGQTQIADILHRLPDDRTRRAALRDAALIMGLTPEPGEAADTEAPRRRVGRPRKAHPESAAC